VCVVNEFDTLNCKITTEL